MHFTRRASALGLALTIGSGIAAPAVAHAYGAPAPEHAVFVQTNDPHRNEVVAYRRANNGTLTLAGRYATGGRGGAQAGAVVDPLASEGSLVYDAADRVLLATNAGSNTITVFGVDGTRLSKRAVVDSRGAFPSSITVRDHVAYVLNAGRQGVVAAFAIVYGTLVPVPYARQALALGNTNPPDFLHSPGDIGVTPDGRHVVVTTKLGGTLVTLATNRYGSLGAPVATPTSGKVPFALEFDALGDVVLSEAGTSSIGTYRVRPNGVVKNIGAPVSDGGAANCWIAQARGYVFVANTGSGTISTFRITAAGKAVLVSAVSATTGGAPIDLAATPDGRFLYSQNGATGNVDGFAVGANGSLTPIGSVGGFTANVFEGIATS